MEERAKLIEDLGGTHYLAEILKQKYTTVLNWKTRGVPWRLRPHIAQMAKEKSVPLPSDFYQSEIAA